MMNIKLLCLLLLLITNFTYAATRSQQPVIINNNNNYGTPQDSSNANQAASTPSCGGGNQNNIYDPRVPPAGTYVQKNGKGNTTNVYTTGENKAYYVDSNCNNNSSPTIQPYINVTPPTSN